MSTDLLGILYEYFNGTLKSSLNYSDTFLFPTSPSDNLISFEYKNNTGEFFYILNNNEDIISDIKSKLKILFEEYYENLDIVSLRFSKSKFSIKLDSLTPSYPKQRKGMHVNHLEKLLKLFPDKAWNWSALSKNPNVTWKMIKDNPLYPWDWREISINPNITWNIIQSNPGYRWNWYAISMNSNITLEPFGFLGTYFLKKVSSGGR